MTRDISTIPRDYLDYIANATIMEGDLAIDPGWYQLWSRDDIATNNKAYEVDESAPGYIGFGSNGGGEMLVFTPDNEIAMIPFVVMEQKDAVVIVKSWSEFEMAIKK